MRIRRSDFNAAAKQFFLICIYRVLFEIVYVYGVVPVYDYTGLTAGRDWIAGIISWAVFVILLIRLISIGDITDAVFSKTVVFVLFLLIYTPFSVMVSRGMFDYEFAIANNVYWFVLVFFLAFCCRFRQKGIPHFAVGKQIIGERFLSIFGFASLALILFISWRYTGFRINLSITNVYDLRSEARSYNWPTIIRYLFGWTRIINSICLCLALVRRKKLMALIFLLNQFLSYGIDGMKSSLFIMALDVFIYVLYRWKLYKNSYTLTAFGFNAVSICSLLEMLIAHSKWIVFMIFYRMEALPVRISYAFYDFFTTHEPDYFRTSFLRLFGVKSPYEGINYMISGLYGGDYNSAANNGLISDAITNMGYLGIAVMPIILVLFFRLFDRFSQGLNKYLILTLGLYGAMTFSNMFFLPNLLTGGWLIALILVLFINREQTGCTDVETTERKEIGDMI